MIGSELFCLGEPAELPKGNQRLFTVLVTISGQSSVVPITYKIFERKTVCRVLTFLRGRNYLVVLRNSNFDPRLSNDFQLQFQLVCI